MLRQTFEALERSLEQNNDTVIDCAKTITEVVCRVIVDTCGMAQSQPASQSGPPSLGSWLTAAVRTLGLGDIRDNRFKKLVSAHHKLAEALNDLRNDAGPASHGRDPFLARLAVHHRRSAVLSADAIVSFLHQAYLDSVRDPVSSREPWERFEASNALIDAHVSVEVDADDDEASTTLRFLLPGGDELALQVEVSRILYQMDRVAYVEALNAARNVDPRDSGDGGGVGDGVLV
jgi:hypothetical protein